VAYSTPEGRKVRQFSRIGTALAEARLVVDQIAAGEVEAAGLTKSDRRDLAAAREKVGGYPLLAALDEWSRARELVGGEIVAACEAWKARKTKFQRVSVAVAVQRFRDAKEGAGVSAATYRVALDRFAADFADRRLDELTARDLGDWLAARGEGWTRNTYRKRVVALFRWSRRQGFLPRDAVTEADQTDRARERTPGRVLVAPAVLERVLHALAFGVDLAHAGRSVEARPDWLPAVVVSAFCGLRSIEAHAQTWEGVNIADRILRVTAAKEGTPTDRTVSIPDCAIRWLLLTPEAERVGPLYRAKTEIFTRVRKYIREVLEVSLPENGLRKSWVSYRLALTQDLAAVALEAGHSAQVEVRHYRGIASSQDARAWFGVMPP